MLPLLEPGDWVFVDPKAQALSGDIVVAYHPYRTDVFMVKHIESIDEDGRMFLVGVNPSESTDSRTQGAVPRSKLIGVVTSKR